MHLLVPFAAPLSDEGRETLRGLRLPALETLLRELTPGERDDGDEYSLSPPHERALARAIGLSGADGAVPWAAHDAAAIGVDTADLAWGRITPVHWHVGPDQVSLLDPAALELADDESQALHDTLRPLFESEGLALIRRGGMDWFAAHEALRNLPTASPDRVIGRSIEPWLPHHPLMRRLQVQAQMLWHTHPVNAQREARGALPVNSFWLSGCGTRQRATSPPPAIDHRLRAPALAGDWPAWADAWRALDAALTPNITTLTLAGERSALRLDLRPRGLWTKLRWSLQGAQAIPLLESL